MMAYECRQEVVTLPFKYSSIAPLSEECGGVQFEQCTLDPSQFILDTDYKYDVDHSSTRNIKVGRAPEISLLDPRSPTQPRTPLHMYPSVSMSPEEVRIPLVVISDTSEIPTQYENIFFDAESEKFILQDNEGYSYGTIRYSLQVSQNGQLSGSYVLRAWKPKPDMVRT